MKRLICALALVGVLLTGWLFAKPPEVIEAIIWRLVNGVATTEYPVAMSKPYLDGTGKTALTSDDSNGIYTEALAGTSPFVRTIPAPAESLVGVNFSFLQTGTTTYQVDPAGGQFRGLYSTNANGDKLELDRVEGSILNVICLKGADGTYYWYTSGMGNITDAN